jgi:hypothetical protein
MVPIGILARPGYSKPTSRRPSAIGTSNDKVVIFAGRLDSTQGKIRATASHRRIGATNTGSVNSDNSVHQNIPYPAIEVSMPTPRMLGSPKAAMQASPRPKAMVLVRKNATAHVRKRLIVLFGLTPWR